MYRVILVIIIITARSVNIIDALKIEVSGSILKIPQTQCLHPWPSQQPAWRMRWLPRVSIVFVQPGKAAIWVEVLQLVPCLRRLVAQTGCSRLLTAGVARLHVRSPECSTDCVCEGEEDTGDRDHLEEDRGDAEAVRGQYAGKQSL